MNVILSPQADFDLENIPYQSSGLVDSAVFLLKSEPRPREIVKWFKVEALTDTTVVREFSRTPPRVYRLKFVDPNNPNRTIDPYRIIYCLDKPHNTVYIFAIPHRKDDPYETGNAAQVQNLLKHYAAFRKGKG